MQSSVAQADSWTIVDGSLKPVPTSSLSIDPTGSIRGDGANPSAAPFESPANNFVSAKRTDLPVATTLPEGQFVLHLASGARLVGRPVSSTDETLTWNSDLLGERSVALSQVVRIDRALAPTSTDAAPLEEDLATLANRDVVRGVLTAIDAESLIITVGEQPTTVALNLLTSLRLAAVAEPADAATYAVTLIDGSIIRGGKLKSISADEWSITTPLGGPAATELKLSTNHVARIEHLAGPVRWLSAMTPTAVEYTPYLGESFPPTMDTTTGSAAGPIVAGDHTYERGIGMHARTIITFPLDGSRTSFRTRYAAQPGLSRTDADVRIRLDDRTVHEARVTGGFISDPIKLDLGTAKTLTLEVDFGSGLHTQDHVNWLEPALLNETVEAVEPAE